MKPTAKHHELSRALRALANPHRLAIFDRIHDDGLCCQNDGRGNTVCAIAENFDLALSTVSHHLKALRDAGLIRCERRGQQVVCAVNLDTLQRIIDLLSPPLATKEAIIPKRKKSRPVPARQSD